ncbi:MAG: hypothetical protein PVJ76_13845 [Gemmatimonadota bacterium]|jgi:hypothetical protein
MGHLTTEGLARLVSEAPTPEEDRHLAGCALCRAELEALREQTDAIGALPDLRPPPGDWEVLEARLASEGLIRSSGLAVRAKRWRSSGWLQAAAALVLFLGGAALGSGVRASNPDDLLAQGEGTGELQLISVGSQAQPASNLVEAADAVNLAERQYMDALLRYRQLLDAQGDPAYVGDPTVRFAALEAIVAAGRAAVQQAPADPYLNGVLVGALAERQALLRKASLTPADGVF